MPLKTRHYGLEAFKFGDIYSASVDKRRFTAIDSQFGFLSDLIGDGVIDGWDISIKSGLTLTVSPGMGIVDKKVMQTFGYLDFDVENNKTKYVYMKKKSDETSGFSGFSNIVEIEATDVTPPSSPLNLVALTDLITYKNIAFSWDQWDSDIDPDFSHYLITRIDEEVYSGEVELGTTTDVLYIDTDLTWDTEYIYRVYSVDLSGNKSDASEITISTLNDDRSPLPPSFLQVISLNESVQILWDESPSNYVEYYEIKISLLDEDYEVESTDTLSLVSSSESFLYKFVEDLTNNRFYRISIRSLSYGSEYSEEIYNIAKPIYREGSGEVRNISISFEESQYENVGIEFDLSWNYYLDEYLSFPDAFLITFIENGIRTSQTVTIKEADSYDNVSQYSSHFKFIPYLDGGTIKYESIKEYTPYLIRIQTKNEDEEISNGVFLRINRTPSYELLSEIENVTVERERTTNNIVAKWDNPTSEYFDYCKITCNILDLLTSETEEYCEDFNNGKSNFFIVPGSYYDINKRFSFTIVPVDIFSRDGDSYSTIKQFSEDINSERPLPPENIKVVSGDSYVELFWKPDTTGGIVYYKIYKNTGVKNSYTADDFSLLATISSDLFSFIDYDVVNDQKYGYIITSVNEYNVESLNPINDGFVPSNIYRGTPFKSTILDAPSNLLISNSGNDVDLTWDLSTGAFDGYQIYRSIGNKYSFELIGSAFSSDTSFTDEDALLIDGQEYYYFIRKYRNEMSLFVTESTVSPTSSVLLGKVVAYVSGGQQIDITDLSTKLKDLETYLEDLTEEKINEHHHTLDGDVDRRIELRANVTINDFTTTDYQTYNTEQDISGAENSIVKISGTINEDYFVNSSGIKNLAAIKKAQFGSSPINYIIDYDNGILTFDSPLYVLCEDGENCPDLPYSTEPVVTIEIKDISEVDNYLPESRLEDINATQMETGEISLVQLPSLSHGGRIGEKLYPLKLPMRSNDNFAYSLTNTYSDNDRNKMGTSLSFYDIIEVGEDSGILAATSSGVYFSSNWGNEWKKRISFPNPVYRIYVSRERKVYAITNYSVYVSNEYTFYSWTKMTGLDGVKIIRDITEDMDNNLYITTDLGVFRLNKSKPYLYNAWEQLPILGVKSTDAYGIMYVYKEDKLYVSNEIGILESSNGGDTWVYSSSFSYAKKVFKFLKSGNYLFALSNNYLYRKEMNDGQFSLISTFSNISKSRHIEVFNDQFYITTDDGIKKSLASDIYTDSSFSFVSVWTDINDRKENTIVTSLNLIDGNLFVGADKQLFIYNGEKTWIQYQQQNTISPTFYINNEKQKLGYYYNNQSAFHNVVFDERQNYEDTVEASNKYDIYYAEYGGWVQQKFDAEVKLWKNKLFNSQSQGTITISQTPFANFTFPDLDDENSNYETAIEYQTLLEDDIEKLTAITLPEQSELRDIISSSYDNYQKFISQLYEDTRKSTVTNDDGSTTEEDLTYPEISVNLVTKSTIVSNSGTVEYQESNIGGVINVSDGKFVFETAFSKEDDLTVDIVGVTISNAGEYTHQEIEDPLEYINSGLPSGLSQVQQINNVKTGIFVEKTWRDQKENISPSYQSEFIIPSGESWYDTLNSTINYTEEIVSDEERKSILYPSAVYYVEDTSQIIVGGNNCVLMIDSTSLNIYDIDIEGLSNEKVKQIKKLNNNIYLLTNKNIYYSEDNGYNWTKIDRSGLPNELCSISSIQNNLIIGAKDGVYFRSSDLMDWDKVLSSETNIEIMMNPDLLFLVVDNEIYTTGDGYTYAKLDVVVSGSIITIGKYRKSIYVSTTNGLYSDGGSFYGSYQSSLTEVDLDNSSDVLVNDLYVGNNDLGIACSDGSYYILDEEGLYMNVESLLSSIHKILIIGDEVYLFGYDLMRVSFCDYPIKLTSGVPL